MPGSDGSLVPSPAAGALAGTFSAPSLAPDAVSGPAGGGLAGSYPSPTIAAGAVTATELGGDARL